MIVPLEIIKIKIQLPASHKFTKRIKALLKPQITKKIEIKNPVNYIIHNTIYGNVSYLFIDTLRGVYIYPTKLFVRF